MRARLLAVTVVLAVALSIGLWLVGLVPFNLYTVGLHTISIYLGVSGVLTYQRWDRRE